MCLLSGVLSVQYFSRTRSLDRAFSGSSGRRQLRATLTPRPLGGRPSEGVDEVQGECGEGVREEGRSS